MNSTNLTHHAAKRLKQRRIPQELVDEALEHGQKIEDWNNGTVLYRLRNVFGIRGYDLMVVTGDNRAIITTYIRPRRAKK